MASDDHIERAGKMAGGHDVLSWACRHPLQAPRQICCLLHTRNASRIAKGFESSHNTRRHGMSGKNVVIPRQVL